MPRLKPEAAAREEIDRALTAAGWVVQHADDVNLYGAVGVAVREFKMADGHGTADYLLFVDQKAVGALEAKKVGHTLTASRGRPATCARVGNLWTAPHGQSLSHRRRMLWAEAGFLAIFKRIGETESWRAAS